MNPRTLLMRCARRETELPVAEKEGYAGKEAVNADNQIHLPDAVPENKSTSQPVPVSQMKNGHAIYTGLMHRHDRIRRRGSGE